MLTTARSPQTTRTLRGTALALVVALFLPAAASAIELPEAAEHRIARLFFAPELVLSNQVRLGLSTAQRDELIREMQETQVDIVPLQARMRAATEELVASLRDRPRLDEAAVVGLASEVLQLEAEIKQRHLRLLIRIKNLLSPEQQRQLWSIRAAGRRAREQYR